MTKKKDIRGTNCIANEHGTCGRCRTNKNIGE